MSTIRIEHFGNNARMLGLIVVYSTGMENIELLSALTTFLVGGTLA
jgi:hypothetical protein